MLKSVSSVTNAIGALNYKGTWNASTNSPTLTSGSGTKGDYYVVGTSGSTSLDGISNWGVGDWAVFNGSTWQRVEGGADLNGVNLTVSGTTTLSGLTASRALALDSSSNITSIVNTGSGNNVLATGPSISGLTVTGTMVMSSLSASTSLALSAGKAITSVTNTGSGNNVLSTSPSIATPTLSGDVNISTGNIVIGTSGKGIDFSITPGIGTSELFSDYEEGDFTPAFSPSGGSFGAIVNDVVFAKYTRVGRTVFIVGHLRTDSLTLGGATGSIRMAGLPLASGSTGMINIVRADLWSVAPYSMSISSGGTVADLYKRSTIGGPTTPSAVADMVTGGVANANEIYFNGFYFV